MQTRARIFDDLSQLMTNAAGVAQGVKGEAETAIKSPCRAYAAGDGSCDPRGIRGRS